MSRHALRKLVSVRSNTPSKKPAEAGSAGIALYCSDGRQPDAKGCAASIQKTPD
jgi:hypothetical protein